MRSAAWRASATTRPIASQAKGMLLTLSHAWSVGAAAVCVRGGPRDSRARMTQFPKGFMWGVCDLGVPDRGAVDVDGRGPSIWDTYAHTPGKIDGGGTGDVACDHYRRWREDVDLIASLERQRVPLLDSRGRGSSPTGGGASSGASTTTTGSIDALLERGIEPVVTLYHWDLPQALEDARRLAEPRHGRALRRVRGACFDAYGDRVTLVADDQRAVDHRPARLPPRAARAGLQRRRARRGDGVPPSAARPRPRRAGVPSGRAYRERRPRAEPRAALPSERRPGGRRGRARVGRLRQPLVPRPGLQRLRIPTT